MAMYDAADAAHVLQANLGISGYTYPAVASTKQRVGSNIGSAGTDMTELAGSGYTPGGSAISWNAVSGQATSNSGALSWTNGSGSSWSIEGTEIWDPSPQRHFFGSYSGYPIYVANGNAFAEAAAGVSAALA
jgi:hypothetical protein